MARGNVTTDQIASGSRLGVGTKLAVSDGTFTLGNAPAFASDGTLTDSGATPGGGGTVVYVNGAFAGNLVNNLDINGALPDVSTLSLNGSTL
jgi:hypothetical protein